MEIAGMDIPSWVFWVVGIVAFLIIFGRNVDWQLEAKLDSESQNPELKDSYAKIEITKYKQKKYGTIIEIFYRLPKELSNDLSLYIDDKFVMNFSASSRHNSRVGSRLSDKNEPRNNRIRQAYKNSPPKEGARITINNGDEVLLAGMLYIDLGSREALNKSS